MDVAAHQTGIPFAHQQRNPPQQRQLQPQAPPPQLLHQRNPYAPPLAFQNPHLQQPQHHGEALAVPPTAGLSPFQHSDASRGTPHYSSADASYPRAFDNTTLQPLNASSWPAQPASPNPHQSPYPMAAPPLPQTPAGGQQSGSNTAPSPKSPQSPGSQAKEPQRIALLLEINVELLQEVNRLQSEGKGGAISVQQQAQLKQAGQPDTLASDDYIQCLRRVQANLGYLMPRAQNDPTKIGHQGPVYMTPPPHLPQMQAKYDQLKELFPGWTGMNPRMQQQANSPTVAGGPARSGTNGSTNSPMSATPMQS